MVDSSWAPSLGGHSTRLDVRLDYLRVIHYPAAQANERDADAPTPVISQCLRGPVRDFCNLVLRQILFHSVTSSPFFSCFDFFSFFPLEQIRVGRVGRVGNFFVAKRKKQKNHGTCLDVAAYSVVSVLAWSYWFKQRA